MDNLEQENYICKKRVAFLNLGCKVNAYETEAMQQKFALAGAKIVAFEEIADIYIINTCTVTNIADRKSRQMLHKAKNKNNSALVVAVGCYVQAAKETLLEDKAIDLLIGNNKKSEAVEIVNLFLKEQQEKNITSLESVNILDLEQNSEYEPLSIETVTEKTRAYIKIQDGCNQFCSYCIIPYARGRIRSRKKEEIVKEVIRLADKDYQEIVLTGIHLSSYGFENKTKAEQASLKPNIGEVPLLELLTELNEIEKIKRIRLSSLEPRIMTEKFIEKLSKLTKICPHFHLSLQSGCDKTLTRMNRKYTTKEYELSCQLLSTYFNKPALTTDIIVGFPGEIQEEFLQTEQFLKKIAFAQMHVFKYSVRKGTKAEQLPHQVPELIKAERSDSLLSLAKQMRKEYESSFINTIQEVLFEESIIQNEKRYMIGHTTRYIKVEIETEKNLQNQIIPVQILKEKESGVWLGIKK